MMTRLLILLLLSLFLISPAYAFGGASLPQGVISSIQDQFQGRIVGMRPLNNNLFEIQVLTAENRMILVTVDASSGAIVNVRE